MQKGQYSGVQLQGVSVFAYLFYTAKIVTAAQHTLPTAANKRLRHKHKIQHTKLSFIPFPFVVLHCLHYEMLIKNLVMQKQLRIITRSRLALCPLSYCHFPLPALPPLVFSRHLGRLPVFYRPALGVRALHLASIGWFVFIYPSGRRCLSALPF